MKKVTPYTNLEEAKASLDNGGSFFNILTKANDGVIEPSELAKVAGAYGDRQMMVLYLDLMLSKFPTKDKEDIIAMLKGDLGESYRKYKAYCCSPAEAMEKGELSSNTIVRGVPKLVERKEKPPYFIMVPIMAGNVTTFSMIPIIEDYEVYSLEPKKGDGTEELLVAHLKTKEKLPEQEIQIAGILKGLNEDEEQVNPSKKFLESIYYAEI
jgi:hypothetical protein